jgi:hypothetical protein
MKVKELKKYPLLWAKLYSYYNREYKDIEERDVSGSITFIETEEGQDFWWHTHCDEIDKAKALFPKLFETDVFTKGMYIVYLGEPSASKSFDTNRVYKQRLNVSYLCPEIDGCGSQSNGWSNIRPLSTNWRPATKKEIEHYDKVGKPYNVTEMNKPSLTFQAGKWYEINYFTNGNMFIEVSEVSVDFVRWNISIKVSDKLVLHYYQKNNWGGYIKDLPIIREVSLSEVQPYLPVNHPDFIKEVNTTPKAVKHQVVEYVECIKGDGTKNYSTVGTILKVDSYYQESGVIFVDGNHIANIFFGDESQIKHNSTDYKISTKEAYDAQNKVEKWTPQIGDWVIPINKDDKDYLRSKFINGFQIVEFSKTNEYARPEIGLTDGIHISKIRKAEPHEIPQSNFTLPDKWVVKITKENSDVLDTWRKQQPDYKNDQWGINTWLTSDCWNDYTYCSFTNGVPTNYTEISYEEFKKHVLKNRPVRAIEEKPIEKIDMIAIQAEAKRKFPIGCSFKNTNDKIHDTLEDDNCVYRIVDNKIYAHEGAGCLYKNGKWAELVKTPTSSSYGYFAETADQVIEIKKPTIFEDSIVNIKVKKPVKTTVELKDTEVKIKVNYKPKIKIS